MKRVATDRSFLTVSLLLLAISSVKADERSGADLLPTTTLVYAELNNSSEVLRYWDTHPLRARIEALDAVQKAWQEKSYLEMRAGVSIVEAKLGQTWQETVKSATSGGLFFGIDQATEGAVLLARARDEEVFPELISTLVSLAEANAREKGGPSPVKSTTYREIEAYEIAKAKLAAFGPWLVITNEGELGKDILDRYLDNRDDSLASQTNFQQARETRQDHATAWLYVNVAEFREQGAAKDLFAGRTENPLAEVLVGGLLDTLKNTPFATAALELPAPHARITLKMPHNHAWVSEAREHYFGAGGTGVAPGLLSVENGILSLSAYRDLAAMWLYAGDLYTDKMVDALAEADSNLATLFSGKDFGEEILGAVEPEVQLVVARQTFKTDQPTPAIKIPAFAAVFRLRDVESMQPEFRRTFQSLIGFLNIVGAMNGQPQLDLDIEKDEAGQIIAARYLVDADSASLSDLKIHYNFGPTVAFVDEHFIVSSTEGLARHLRSILRDAQPDATKANVVARTDAQQLQAILADNRGQLIAQNMLSEGHSKGEAEQAIDDVLSLVGALRDASLSLQHVTDQLELQFELQFTE